MVKFSVSFRLSLKIFCLGQPILVLTGVHIISHILRKSVFNDRGHFSNLLFSLYLYQSSLSEKKTYLAYGGSQFPTGVIFLRVSTRRKWTPRTVILHVNHIVFLRPEGHYSTTKNDHWVVFRRGHYSSLHRQHCKNGLSN